MIGKKLAHYEILEQLGEGGMGVVYKARDAHLDRFVAIKILPAERVSDPARKRRFELEAKSASALNHPNIVTIHDIAEADGVNYIVMEYVAGRTLAEAIPRRGLALSNALAYAIPAADALAAAHVAGIVHRDLKPANIMIGDDGRVKVLDFGLAKLVEEDGSGSEEAPTLAADDRVETAEGLLVGTVGYMSPEQAEGKRLDARSDIFSFGAVLYEMVTGQRAFRGDSSASTLAAVLSSEPRPASEVVPDLPRELERVLSRCLRKDPARRVQHMDDLKVALQELKEESDSGVLSSATPRRAASRAPCGGAPARLADTGLGWKPGALDLFAQRGPAVAWQSDRRLVTLGRERPDEVALFALDVETGERSRLTEPPRGADMHPAVSPDGRSLAFVRQGNHGTTQLYVLPLSADGEPDGEPRLIPIEAAAVAGPAWTTDGRDLLCSAGAAYMTNMRLWRVPVSGEGQAVPLPFGEDGIMPAVAATGERLAYVVLPDVDSDIFRVDLEAGGDVAPERLIASTRPENLPAWSPDGSRVAFGSARSGTQEVWICEEDGSNPRQLTFMDSQAGTARWFPDGRRIAFDAREDGQSDVFVIDVAGSVPRRVTESPADDRVPSVSADGRWISFASNRSGRYEIWRIPAGGGEAVQVTRGGGDVPGESPSGDLVYFQRLSGGGRYEL